MAYGAPAIHLRRNFPAKMCFEFCAFRWFEKIKTEACLGFLHKDQEESPFTNSERFRTILNDFELSAFIWFARSFDFGTPLS